MKNNLDSYPECNDKRNKEIKSILYLHVGKTAGSSIRHIFKDKLTHICHLKKPSIDILNKADLIIISIKDPIDRFLSAFNYAHKIINYDVSNLNKNSNFSKLIAPFHIKNKVTRGYAYNQEYNELINYFKTPNNLAESLTSINDRDRAHKLMTNNTEHIYKSLGYYSNNGRIIKKYHHKIEIISSEFFDRDIKRVYKKIYNREYANNKDIVLRKNINKNNYLSKLAIENLYNFYKDTDYKTIEIMYRYNLISNELYDKYVSKYTDIITDIDTITNRELIISFCNFDYIKLAKIWVKELRKLKITNYLIISADNKTFTYLKSQNINTELREYNNEKSFWVYRIKVIYDILEKNNFNYLIHSDLDAIWKKNIINELFNENKEIDLFFSQGTTFPKKHLLKHKFVLCCGFFCIKYNKKVLSFFDKYIKEVEKIKDDQVAINLELINTNWTLSSKSNSNKSYVYFEEDIIGYNQDYDLKILLISFNKIQREFINNNGYIYHIISPKNCLRKIYLFKRLKIIG